MILFLSGLGVGILIGAMRPICEGLWDRAPIPVGSRWVIEPLGSMVWRVHDTDNFPPADARLESGRFGSDDRQTVKVSLRYLRKYGRRATEIDEAAAGGVA